MANMKLLISITCGASALMAAAFAQDEAAPIDAPPSMLENAYGEPLGWTLPLSPEGERDEETELDRLSKSVSGVGFSGTLYDSQSDNPLVPVAVTLRALDKITATYKDIEIEIGEEVQFGALSLKPRTCDKRPPEEFPETTVFLEVFTTQDDVQGARTRASRGDSALPPVSSIALPGEDVTAPVRPALFRGWMFASSPSINALEHPVYDVWVIDCKMEDPRT